MKHAYDGYIIGNQKSMFNPNSIMQLILFCNNNKADSKHEVELHTLSSSAS